MVLLSLTKERTNIIPPADVDVILVAPKGSGTSLRRMFLQGRGLNSSYAIFQDATGRAWDRVIALGIGVGSGYLFETTFKKEVYSDLTGERGTLMGAIQGLLLAQYETLRENGHEPSRSIQRNSRRTDSVFECRCLLKTEWTGCMQTVRLLHSVAL